MARKTIAPPLMHPKMKASIAADQRRALREIQARLSTEPWHQRMAENHGNAWKAFRGSSPNMKE